MSGLTGSHIIARRIRLSMGDVMLTQFAPSQKQLVAKPGHHIVVNIKLSKQSMFSAKRWLTVQFRWRLPNKQTSKR
jgi:hypothetical protein